MRSGASLLYVNDVIQRRALLDEPDRQHLYARSYALSPADAE